MNESVTVYGVDHSPWVQGVCLALFRLGVPYRLVSQPFGIGAYLRWGMVMPVVRWSHGDCTSDSFAIYDELSSRYAGTSDSGLSAHDQAELERFFVGYVLARAGPGKTGSFLLAWAQMRSDQGGGFNSVFRALLFLYFYLLILAGRRRAVARGGAPDAVDPWAAGLDQWAHRLDSKPFFGGDQPGFLDDAMFGHIQCLASGLTPEAFARFRAHTTLNAWMDRMNQRCLDYRHLHSLDGRQPEAASLGDQLLFYGSLVAAIVAAPVTLIGFIDALRRRSHNPNRSGERIRRRP